MKRKRKKSINILDILRYFIVILFIIYIVILKTSKGANNIPVKTIEKNILQVAATDEMKKGSTQDLKRLYGLNANDYDGTMLYIPTDIMSVNEIIVIKLKDSAQFDSVEKALKNRIDTQLQNFDGYGVEQTKLINSAIIETKGNYMLMAIADNVDDIYKAFKKSL